MNEYLVEPTIGIGPVRFGMGREEVRELLGSPNYVEAAHEKWGIQFPAKDCFFDSCIQIRYDLDEKVEDIQYSAHPSFSVVFDSIPVHDSDVDTIAKAIERSAKLNRGEREFPHVYSFPDIGLSLWREHLGKSKFDTINLRRPESESEKKEANQLLRPTEQVKSGGGELGGQG